MRVIQLGPLPPPHGGVSTNLLSIHRLLVDSGHHSSIVAITGTSDVNAIANAYKPRSAVELLRLLFRLDADIVHFHVGGDFSTRLAILMLICGFLPGKRSVVTFHSGGYAREVVRLAKPFSLRGCAFRSADFLIGVNSEMIAMFQAFGAAENKMRLILPFELERSDPAIAVPPDLVEFIASHSPFLLAVGGLEPEYSHSFTIDAMAEVLARFPKAGLMIVGSGSLDSELRNRVAGKRYAKNIRLVDDIGHSVLLHLIANADAFLRLTQYDGDAISVREALFLNTPVIATETGMRPDGVHLVSRELDARELTEGVTMVVTSEHKAVHADGGRENIEAVLEVYQQLLKDQ